MAATKAGLDGMEAPRRPLSLEQAFAKYIGLTESQSYEKGDVMAFIVRKLAPEELLAAVISYLHGRSNGRLQETENFLLQLGSDILKGCQEEGRLYTGVGKLTTDEKLRKKDLEKVARLGDHFTTLSFRLREQKNHTKCMEALGKIKKALKNHKKDFVKFEL